MSSASTGGTEGSSPASSPASAASQAMSAPKYGTLVPNRIFVGGISASTSEAELAQLFSAYGNVKATKIISDRAGVSKGYGFVTFETEEEAKRLQQESECIILRERKLNIAPAIKKQPFNRSFDGGSGSPPAVPTSPYYYTNGMGLPYQNGLTFYNAGAPTPGTPLAPPTDPTAIYQAAGVFGPQAASAHQTFAPMMYPCPAPSLYMPQQYQYSPMPYESYYTGAAGAPQYLYTTSNGTSNGSTNVTAGGSSSSSAGNGIGGVGGNGGGGGGGGTASPSASHGLTIPSGPTHYYTTQGPPPTGAPSHHHHHPMTNGPPGAPQQLDHLYYSFTAAGPPHTHQPPPQHGPIGIGDQQLLLYTTDASCQQSANNSDGQLAPQEETRSASSHSEQQSQHHTPAQSTPGNEPHITTATTPLMSIMPVKYPMTNRYPNYHHPLTLHHHHQPPSTQLPPHPHHHHHHNPSAICSTDTDDTNQNPLHCRTILYHPVYIQNPYQNNNNNNNNNNNSLLPTPQYDGNKTRDSTNHTQTNKFIHTRQNNYNLFTTVPPNVYSGKALAPKYPVTPRANNNNYRKNSTTTTTTPMCYITRAGNSNLLQKTTNNTRNIETNNNRRHLNSDFAVKRQNYSTMTTTTPTTVSITTTKSVNSIGNNTSSSCENVNIVNDKSTSPPPAPYSPMTRPLPILSPPNVQVQFYTAQSRYQSNQQQQQQQSSSTRRFNSMSSQMSTSGGRKTMDKFNSTITPTTHHQQGVILRNKFKVNGIISTNKNIIEEGLGGAGDAQQTVGRMPLTPPGTPRNLQDSNQINDTCHQIQALTL